MSVWFFFPSANSRYRPKHDKKKHPVCGPGSVSYNLMINNDISSQLDVTVPVPSPMKNRFRNTARDSRSCIPLAFPRWQKGMFAGLRETLQQKNVVRIIHGKDLVLWVINPCSNCFPHISPQNQWGFRVLKMVPSRHWHYRTSQIRPDGASHSQQAIWSNLEGRFIHDEV